MVKSGPLKMDGLVDCFLFGKARFGEAKINKGQTTNLCCDATTSDR